ncbi:MAG: DUF4932 domain-containing protein [Bacteroidales bacterium]|nr:DUF4932 domain-containing protein [Bacteroidales bacterium]
MIRKTLKIIRNLLLLLLIPILIIGIIYIINPKYIENKAMDLFCPTVNINDEYLNKIVVETPEVYELMQIACSLTETFQADENLIFKGTYYKEVETYFIPFKNHELISKLNEYFKANPYGNSQHTIRILSLNYKINNNNELIYSEIIKVKTILLKLFKTKVFLVPENLDLIESFAKKSNFKDFYNNHKDYYSKLISNYHKLCNFEHMKNWLESKFSVEYQSYRIVFSPLTGGFHSTTKFKDKVKNIEQTFMYVSAPYENIEGLSDKDFEIKAGGKAREVFSEIDHNYVNPLTDKYLKELEKAMPDYLFWNNQKSKSSSYKSSYGTFNEYMTWGVFSLYAIDTYSEENVDTIIKIQADIINDNRKFNRFREFNDELIKQYKENSKPEIEKLYVPMLEWMKKKSAPKNVNSKQGVQ